MYIMIPQIVFELSAVCSLSKCIIFEVSATICFNFCTRVTGFVNQLNDILSIIIKKNYCEKFILSLLCFQLTEQQ